MTRAEIRAEAKLRIEDPDNAIATDDQINSWINQAVRAVARAWHWPFLRKSAAFNTVINSHDVSLTVEVGRIIRVLHNDTTGSKKQPLEYKPRNWLETELTSTTETGTPLLWTVGGLVQTSPTAVPVPSIYVYPKDGTEHALEIHYLRIPPKLTADDQIPFLPEEFDEAVTLWVMRRFYRQIGDDVFYADADRDFDRELKTLTDTWGVPQHEEFYTVELPTDI